MSLLGEVKKRDTLEVIHNTKGDSEIQTQKNNPEKKKTNERGRDELGVRY